MLQELLKTTRAMQHTEGFLDDLPEHVADSWTDQAGRRVARLGRLLTSHKPAPGKKDRPLPGHHRVESVLADCLEHVSDANVRVEVVESLWPLFKGSYWQHISDMVTDRNRGRPMRPMARFREANLYRTFAEAGNPRRALELLDVPTTPPPPGTIGTMPRPSSRTKRKKRPPPAAAPPVPKASARKPGDTPSTARPARRPRPSGPHRPKKSDLLTSIPQISAPIRPIPEFSISWSRWSRRQQRGPSIRDMAYGNGELWIVHGASLHVYDPAANRLRSTGETLGRHSSVNAVLQREGVLWMTLQHDGIWSLDLDSKHVRRFSGEDGVQSMTMQQIAATDKAMYFAGPDRTSALIISSYDPDRDEWGQVQLDRPADQPDRKVSAGTGNRTRLTAYGRWLLTWPSELRLHDTSNGKTEDLSAIIDEIQFKQFKSGDDPQAASARRNRHQLAPAFGRIRTCIADETGFWIGSSGRLVHVNPATLVLQDLSVIGMMVNLLIDDGDVLWVGAKIGHTSGKRTRNATPRSWVLALHKPTRRWIARFAVPCDPAVMTAAPHRLWIAAEPKGGRLEAELWQVSKRPVLERPESSWVPHVLAQYELEETVRRGGHSHVAVMMRDPQFWAIAGLAILLFGAFGYYKVRKRRRAVAGADRSSA